MSYAFSDGDPIKALDTEVNRECGFLPENSSGYIVLVRDKLVSFYIKKGSMGGGYIEGVCSTDVFSTYFSHRGSVLSNKAYSVKTHYTKLYPNAFRKDTKQNSK